MTEALPSPDLQPALAAALGLFRPAALAGTATVRLAGAVLNHLKLARHNPSLPFEPPASVS
ncbi:MAG TPA: hypothetical protein VOA87_15605 [Thermoanaerobaculia bacterium]|nr:hypothetical protein [Thermoanaerobaculia bacterium]